nr:uncharacterized protein LOC129476750 [Symphalangus syndactylus]
MPCERARCFYVCSFSLHTGIGPSYSASDRAEPRPSPGGKLTARIWIKGVKENGGTMQGAVDWGEGVKDAQGGILRAIRLQTNGIRHGVPSVVRPSLERQLLDREWVSALLSCPPPSCPDWDRDSGRACAVCAEEPQSLPQGKAKLRKEVVEIILIVNMSGWLSFLRHDVDDIVLKHFHDMCKFQGLTLYLEVEDWRMVVNFQQFTQEILSCS